MSRVVVIGAGPMGLAAAWHASKAGHNVVVLEADRVPGGMAAHFDFGGLSIERFYHFICKPDQATFDLMAELGIADRLRWRATSMGYYIDGKLYRWGDPLALLSFPLLGRDRQVPLCAARVHGVKAPRLVRARTFECARLDRCASGREDLEPAVEAQLRPQVLRACGLGVRPVARGSDQAVGCFSPIVFQEELGYIDGGTEILVGALVKGIEANGGKVLCREPVQQVEIRDGMVAGARTPNGWHDADHVISTMAIPYVTKLIPGLPDAHRAKLEAIRNIGVVCVVLKLSKAVTPHFWVNINDPRIEVPGFVEFSNLRPMREHIIYVPFYMPQGNPKFSRDDLAFIAESKNVVKMVNPDINDDDFIDVALGRLRYAQPVCEPGFADKLPDIQTPIRGLQIADTSFYYPEDRGVSESVKLAKQMADRIT